MVLRVAAIAALLATCVAAPARAQWSGSQGGTIRTWSTTSGADSDALVVSEWSALCVNTGATDWTVYFANPTTGAKLSSVYKGPIAATGSADCSDQATCGAVALPPQSYVLDCAATTCSAVCVGR